MWIVNIKLTVMDLASGLYSALEHYIFIVVVVVDRIPMPLMDVIHTEHPPKDETDSEFSIGT